MKLTTIVMVTLALFAVILSTGCATSGKMETGETIPVIQVAHNSSGIEVQASQTHGPKNFLGAIGVAPDVPSGVVVSIGRIHPLHNTEPRYFIPASGRLQVVSIERPANYTNFEDIINKWRLLFGQSITANETHKILYTDQLSEIPWMNAGRCFHAKLRYRKFPWGNAVLFLTSYVQGNTGGPVNNDMLVLTLQGITVNGRYAVNGHFEIRHPNLPESSWDRSKKGKAVFDIDNEDDKAERWLDAQPDDSFQPTFLQYETFLQSLQIEPPAKK